MLDQGGLDLCRGKTVTGHIHDVVHTATDPVVSIVVTAGTITGELEKKKRIGVSGCPENAGRKHLT